jgi:hypothetical protein
MTLPSRSDDVARDTLRASRRVLLVSFIGPDVPATLTACGFEVFAKVGPGPDAWACCHREGGNIRFEPSNKPPQDIDLVHLDVSEAFNEYLAVAKSLGAKTFWFHSGRTAPDEPHDDRGCWLPREISERQRAAGEAMGLVYIDDRYIADVARSLGRI